jgi:DNA-binding response OmpR family regulator
MDNLEVLVPREAIERAPTVLLVEDEVLIRLALADYLQECGFTVFDVGCAAEALSVLEASEFLIDVVLTDVRMPGEMDGLDLVRWLRCNRPELPVLITTGDKSKAEAARDLCEKNAIIEKPHNPDLVVSRIRAAVCAAKERPAAVQAR